MLTALSNDCVASTFIYNKTNDTIRLVVMSAYDGGSATDGNFQKYNTVTLKPGESKEYGIKFMKTNTIWIVPTPDSRQVLEFKSKISSSKASVKVEKVYLPKTSGKHSNEFVTAAMKSRNWDALKNFIGEDKLASKNKLGAIRVDPKPKHGQDPGASIRFNSDKTITLRTW